MTFPKARLVVSACLFFGWIGFLLYLVIESPTVILSKPQFLVAALYVTADVQADEKKADPRVTIDEVIWCADPVDAALTTKAIVVPSLSLCGKSEGFTGTGKYVLALSKRGTGAAATFYITPLPTMNARIYPLTKQTRTQVDGIVALRK